MDIKNFLGIRKNIYCKNLSRIIYTTDDISQFKYHQQLPNIQEEDVKIKTQVRHFLRSALWLQGETISATLVHPPYHHHFQPRSRASLQSGQVREGLL